MQEIITIIAIITGTLIGTTLFIDTIKETAKAVVKTIW